MTPAEMLRSKRLPFKDAINLLHAFFPKLEIKTIVQYVEMKYTKPRDYGISFEHIVDDVKELESFKS